jgi:hypothetical protein
VVNWWFSYIIKFIYITTYAYYSRT